MIRPLVLLTGLAIFLISGVETVHAQNGNQGSNSLSNQLGKLRDSINLPFGGANSRQQGGGESTRTDFNRRRRSPHMTNATRSRSVRKSSSNRDPFSNSGQQATKQNGAANTPTPVVIEFPTESGAKANSNATSASRTTNDTQGFKPARKATPSGASDQLAAPPARHTVVDRPKTASRSKTNASHKQSSLQKRLAAMRKASLKEDSTPSEPAVAKSESKVEPKQERAGVPTLARRPSTEQAASPVKTNKAQGVPTLAKTPEKKETVSPTLADKPLAKAVEKTASKSDIQSSAADVPVAKARVTDVPVTKSTPTVAPAAVKETPRVARSATARMDHVTASSQPKGEQFLLTQQSPQISTQVAGPRKISLGQPAPFRVLVKNSGDIEAEDLVVTINIPRWAEVVGRKPSIGSSRWEEQQGEQRPLQWHVGQLAANGQASIELQVVARESKPLKLAVRWSHAPSSSGAVVEVQEPKLLMVVSGPDEVLYGETKVYKLTLSNPGTGPAENVMINLAPVGRKTGTAGGHRVGSLEPGESKHLEIELTAREAGQLNVSASATADGGLSTSSEKTVIVLRPGLQIELAGPEKQFAGTVGIYKIRVTNPGTATARDVTVAGAMPLGAKVLTAAGATESGAESGKVAWVIEALEPGDQRDFVVKCQFNQPGTNRLQVMGEGQNGLVDSNTTTTEVIALADLKLDVSDPRGPVAVGEEALYEIRIQNRGTKAAEAIEIDAFFSEGVEPFAAEGSPNRIGDGHVRFDTIRTLPPNSEVVLKVRGKANRSGNLIFRAQLRCSSSDTKLAAEETTRFYDISSE